MVRAGPGLEQFLFYFSPALGWGVIFSAVCWAILRRVPYVGVTVAVAALLLMAYAGRA